MTARLLRNIPGDGPVRRGARRRRMYRAPVFAAALALCFLSPGQNADLTENGKAQVSELNQRLASRKLEAKELVEFSKLLAEPGDQLEWLSEKMPAPTDTSAEAKTLRETILARGATIEKRPDFGKTDKTAKSLARLKEKAKSNEMAGTGTGGTGTGGTNTSGGSKPPIEDETDPAQLKQRLASERPTGLAFDKTFKLLARGASPDELNLKNLNYTRDVTRWDAAKLPYGSQIIVTQLGEGKLETAKLLDYRRCLNEAKKSASSPAADSALRIVGTLVDRALGAAGPDDNPSAWDRTAQQLESEQLWGWATLARILQAGGDAQRSGALALAEKQFNNYKLVAGASAGGAAGLQKICEDLLGRLRNNDLSSSGKIPLDMDFRAQADRARKTAEDAFVQAFNARNYDEAFRQMQLAKAAEIGLEIAPLQSVTELVSLLPAANASGRKRTPQCNLYLEWLQVGGTCYYVMVRSKELGDIDTNEFLPPTWGQKSDPNQLISDAARETFAGNSSYDGKIILAPDRESRLQAWHTGGAPLSAYCGGWLVYLPTAAVLKTKSGWTADRVLRLWYQSGVTNLDYLADGSSLKRVGTSAAPQFQRLHVIHLDGKYPTGFDISTVTDIGKKLKNANVKILVIAASTE